MILSFFGKAVTAGKITVMGNMQAQRFYNRLTVFEIKDIIFINIRGKQAGLLLYNSNTSSMASVHFFLCGTSGVPHN